jgi:polyphosphate glucokinase
MMNYFGIDIGGTAIKFGGVNFENQISTIDFDMMLIPQTLRTERYTNALTSLLQSAEMYKGVGIGFPSVVWEDGIMDLEIRYNDIWNTASQILNEKHVPYFAINDADAAGFAELYHPGAEQFRKGATVVLTLGTGIGSAIFIDGKLLPNSELGMVEIHGMMAEHYAAPSVKRQESLGMREWASRLQEYVNHLEIILSPDHIILGGGISSDFEEYRPYLSTKRASLSPAFYRNQAGVVGAAMYAAYRTNDYTFQYNKASEHISE